MRTKVCPHCLAPENGKAFVSGYRCGSFWLDQEPRLFQSWACQQIETLQTARGGNLMLIEQLCREIRDKLRLHQCRHKACDCYRARELLSTLDALARVRFPWHPDLFVPEESELSQKQMNDPK